jgi:hypothetical protein
MSNSNVLIGKSSWGKGNFGNSGVSSGSSWFYVEDNKDNVYRVLPPIKSLAQEGKVLKYYRTHRGFRGSDGRQKPFICIEQSDYKTKLIRTHCPVCDLVSELTQELEKARAKGATQEQLTEFRNKNIFPIQVESKYYLNVVNQDGKIGILPIGSKMKNALEALAKEQEKKGRDISGMEGVFINFKKATRYKGDRDAVHSVEIFMRPDNDGSFRYATHTITAEFAERIGKEAADLNNIFKSLDADQIARIVSLEGEDRAAYVDSLFLAPERQESTQSTVPGGNFTAVSRVESSENGGFTVQQPTLPTNFYSGSTTMPDNSGSFQGNQRVSTPDLFGSPKASSAPISSLSDDDFMAMVKPQSRG